METRALTDEQFAEHVRTLRGDPPGWVRPLYMQRPSDLTLVLVLAGNRRQAFEFSQRHPELECRYVDVVSSMGGHRHAKFVVVGTFWEDVRFPTEFFDYAESRYARLDVDDPDVAR